MPKLLVVDDQEEIHRLLFQLFRDCEIQSAYQGAEALEIVEQWSPDVIVCDYSMPGMNGVETLALLRERVPEAMRILMSATAEREAQLAGDGQALVHQFIGKPFHIQTLRLVVEGLLRERQLCTEKQALEKQLKSATRSLQEQETLLEYLVEQRTVALAQAKEDLERSNSQLEDSNLELMRSNKNLRESLMRDDLTLLYTRQYIVEQLRVEVARAQRYERPLAVLFADIDNFKKINDTFGHQIGDAVLAQFGKFFRSSTWRATDLAGRYGGEEFLILLPETDQRGAVRKGERLRRTIRKFAWTEIHPELGVVTASFGAAFYPEDGTSYATLVGIADQRLYLAKRYGKDKVVTGGQTRMKHLSSGPRLASGTQNLPVRESEQAAPVPLPVDREALALPEQPLPETRSGDALLNSARCAPRTNR